MEKIIIKKMNKKAGAGKEWIYALSIIFAISILYIIFNGVFVHDLSPIFLELMPDTDAGATGTAGILTYLTYWKFIPILLVGGLIIYMLLITVRKEPTENY